MVGAGPAGAAFALNLARFRNVLLVDRQPAAEVRIGESLAPAARRLLTDMGLWESFLEQGHLPVHAGRSVWGADEPGERDGLRDLDGPGWHLDRARFDDWLRAEAVRRGAALLMPAAVGPVTRDGDGWQLDLTLQGRTIPIKARLIVDAGGRTSVLARECGSRRVAGDRLVCAWIHGSVSPDRQGGLTHIEAEPDGWWYTAPLPDNRRVVAFYTDSDLAAATGAISPDRLMQRAAHRLFLAGVLSASGFAPTGVGGFCAAHSASLDEFAGPGWLAVGDAALSFDPLSSRGLFNALYTGLAGAEAANRTLNGDATAFGDYQAGILSIRAAYQAHLQAWYGLERRWAERPFWRRRCGPLPPPP